MNGTLLGDRDRTAGEAGMSNSDDTWGGRSGRKIIERWGGIWEGGTDKLSLLVGDL